MKSARTKTNDRVYQLKIVLINIEPLIWRRFVVNSSLLLPKLHDVIQTVMGWTNSHLHMFVIGGKYYHGPDEEAMTEFVDYRRVKLDQVIRRARAKFHYEYDFGDCWEHTITLERILPRDRAVTYPICVDGERSCPPEDCGGYPGYAHLLQVLGDPQHEEYDELKEWVGDDFDPEEFDVKLVNKMLRR
ncbi:plasmid pRiA4b ORF-3 family protein [candidate division WOR-3 bacterium]|nr:plasmid pRiA4b ORF-3 family protein [candidate division WOR-3 bacterium]